MISIRKLVGALCLASYCLLSNAETVVQDHNISDDGYAHVPFQGGFTFPYYGQTFTESWMFSNGIISFQDPVQSGLAWSNLGIQNFSAQMSSQFNYSIYPLWTDLININGTFRTEGSSQFQRYSWIGISPFYDSTRLNTFSVELRTDGRIITNYSLINADYAVVGTIGDASKGEFEEIHASWSPVTTGSISNWERYTGAVDPCVINPQSDPDCYGYVAPPPPAPDCDADPASCGIVVNPEPEPQPEPETPGNVCNVNPYAAQCLQQADSNDNSTIEFTSPTLASSASSSTSGIEDPTKTESVVTVDVGGAELSLTGEVSIPTGQPAASKESSQSTETQESQTRERRPADRRAVSVALSSAREAEKSAQETAENAVELSQVDQLTSAAIGLGSGITLHNFRPLGLNEESSETALNLNSSTAATSKDQDNKTLIPQDAAQQTGPSVRGGGKVEGMEGGPDPDALATAPMDFNQYLNAQLRDSQFYQSREIYRGQRNVDNQRLLRGLTGGSDRLHQEMVNEQYK